MFREKFANFNEFYNGYERINIRNNYGFLHVAAYVKQYRTAYYNGKMARGFGMRFLNLKFVRFGGSMRSKKCDS